MPNVAFYLNVESETSRYCHANGASLDTRRLESATCEPFAAMSTGTGGPERGREEDSDMSAEARSVAVRAASGATVAPALESVSSGESLGAKSFSSVTMSTASKPCSIRVPSELQDAGGDLEPGSYFISKVGNMDLLQL